jgi:methionyl-tRNA formyltransferase
MQNAKKIGYFGTPDFSTFVLDELVKAGFTPDVVITTPDKPAGRGLVLTESPVKQYSSQHNITVLQPEKIDATFIETLKGYDLDLLVVAAYGKILPETLLQITPYPPLNVHPSLLPQYRGTSPVESQILAGETVIGVTVIQMDDKMDHGPIVAQEKIDVPEIITKKELNTLLWTAGGQLLVRILPQWFSKEIVPTPQDETKATFTKKMHKEDGLISLDEEPVVLNRKFRAYHPWPGLFFTVKKDGKEVRVKIKAAHLEDGRFVLDTVIPENGKPLSGSDFQRWLVS